MRVWCGLVALVVSLVLGVTAHAGTSDTVARLVVDGRKDTAEVVIQGSFPVPSYSLNAIDNGKKVIVEVHGAKLHEQGVRVQGTAALVVRSTASTSARGVRVVLDTTRPVTYRARSESGKIRISLDADGQAPAQGAQKGTRAKSGQPQLQHVIIERRNGRERVVAELDRPAEFRVLPGKDAARLELRGVRLAGDVPSELQGDSLSVVKHVQIVQVGSGVVLEVNGDKQLSGTAIREGNRVVWMFAPPRAQQARGTKTRTVAKEEALEIDGQEVAAFLSDVPMQIAGARSRRKYTGRRIDLDFKDADIHNILRLLSEVGNINIVTADDVSGAVTIKLRNVPWDQALDVILTAKGLGMVRRGNLVRVAPQTTLEKEREMAIARQKQRVELAPLETRLVPVSYGDAMDLQARVKELLSERGKVSVDKRTNILVVRDVAETLDDVEELVRSLDSQTPQVLIEARIVEATTSFSTEFGIQWGGSLVMSSATGNPTGLVFPHDVSVSGGAHDGQQPSFGLSPFSIQVPQPNFAVNLPAPVGLGSGGAIGMSLGSLAGNFNLNVRLSAFEATGQVRIISSPRVLTLDNHEATIKQGTSIPYSQVSAQGVQTAFREASLQLKVTPHVTSDGAVSMTVDITRDEPDFNQTSARGDPTILKRQAQTSLLVHDGHTAVIGGIYTRNTGRGLDQVPFFGDIPIIGILFQHRRESDSRNELLIFITPRIVNRAASLDR